MMAEEWTSTEERVRRSIRIDGPDERAGERIRSSVDSRQHGTRMHWRPLARHPLGVGLVAVALLAALAWAFWPRPISATDVAQQALASVTRPDTVLHFTMDTRRVYAYDPAMDGGPLGVGDVRSRDEVWVDYGTGRMRVRQFESRDSGFRLMSDSLIEDGVSRTLRTPEGGGEPTLHETDVTEMGSRVFLVKSYADMLRNGTVEVLSINRTTVRVRIEHEVSESGSHSVIEGVLRRTDYLPVSMRFEYWLPGSVDASHRAGSVDEAEVDARVVSVAETPDATFDFDVPAGARFTVSRMLDEVEASAMTSPTVYWLGRRYREGEAVGGFFYQSAPYLPRGYYGFRPHEWREARFADKHVVVGYWIDGDDHPYNVFPLSGGGASMEVRTPAIRVASMTPADVRLRMSRFPGVFDDYAAWEGLVEGTREQVVFTARSQSYVARRIGDTIVVVISDDPIAARVSADLVRPVIG